MKIIKPYKDKDEILKRISFAKENGGIYIKSTTTINIDVPDVYVALSGDQVALTDIHVS